MGALKLTYYETKNPLKVVYSKTLEERKSVQRFLSVDPLASKYNYITPYSYCNSNPTNTIDFDGRDIIVLNAPQAVGGLGHAAVLIGNDKDGWRLYSKNGTFGSSGIQEQSSGESNKFPDKGEYFKSLYQFANSRKNFQMNEGGDVEYTSAFRIQTDTKADAKMRRAALKSVKSYYNVVTNSCIDVCSDALEAGGSDGGTEIEYNQDGQPYSTKSSIPNVRYNKIRQNNQGTSATRSITPTEQIKRQMKGNSFQVIQGQQDAEQKMPQTWGEIFE